MVLLARLRELTEGYSCPEDACDGYRRAMKLMEEFEVDTHEHIRKENEVLFPKAIELEASTRG